MESVGLEPTTETVPSLHALLTELRLLFVPIQDFFPPFDRTHKQAGFFEQTLFLLTTTLMIRATTHLVPPRILTYN